MDNDIFTVKNIDVYAESDNLENAKSEAINIGIQHAFDKLLDKIIVSRSRWRIDAIKSSEALSAFEDYKIVKERLTAYSFTGTIDIRFSPSQIKTILNKMGITYYDEYSAVNLVIPILHRDDKVIIWGNDPWSKEWGHAPATVGLSRFAFALGDLYDIDAVDPKIALMLPYKKFLGILDRYKAENIIIIVANDFGNDISAEVRVLSKKGEKRKYQRYNFKQHNKLPLKEKYKKITNDLLNRIDTLWKGIDLFEEPSLYKTTFRAVFDSPKNWALFRKKLNSLQYVKEYKIIKSNMSSVDIQFLHSMELNEFSNLLLKSGFEIIQGEGNLILTYTPK